MKEDHNTNSKKYPLSDEFRVACQIYHYNQQNVPVYSEMLGEIEDMLKNPVSKTINTLYDWGYIVVSGNGKDKQGNNVHLLEISPEHKDVVKSMYWDSWVKTRGYPEIFHSNFIFLIGVDGRIGCKEEGDNGFTDSSPQDMREIADLCENLLIAKTNEEKTTHRDALQKKLQDKVWY